MMRVMVSPPPQCAAGSARAALGDDPAPHSGAIRFEGDFGHYVEATLRAMGGTEALEALGASGLRQNATHAS